jgi:hypothetical protein
VLSGEFTGPDNMQSRMWMPALVLIDRVGELVEHRRSYAGQLIMAHYTDLTLEQRSGPVIPTFEEVQELYSEKLTHNVAGQPQISWQFKRGTGEWLNKVVVRSRTESIATAIRSVLAFEAPTLASLSGERLKELAEGLDIVDTRPRKR